MAARPVVRCDCDAAHCRHHSGKRTSAVILSYVFDIGLAVLILGIGGATVTTRSAFAAVIAFVVYGLLLAIAWVRLAAVDVALTEAAIGGGMTGMLLLRAAARLRSGGADGGGVRKP